MIQFSVLPSQLGPALWEHKYSLFSITLQESDSRIFCVPIFLIFGTKMEIYNILTFVNSHEPCYLFQHDGARAELTDAQNQMEIIKEKIKTKDTFITELQGKIEKHQSEASEARKVEQVNHFISVLSHFFSLQPLSSAALCS